MSGDQISAPSQEMDDAPLVSVIMNCYNGETYLREAIDSIYAQVYPNWEIVFWDNASTDSSPDIAQSYDDRLRYFRGGENIPLGAARNRALTETRGEFIAFLDTDDIWFADTLQTLVDSMHDSDFALSYAGLFKIDSQGNEIDKFIPTKGSGQIFDALLKQFDIPIVTAIVRKEALEESGLGFDGNVIASEEYCLFMQLAARYPIRSIPQAIMKYRVHNKSLTANSMSQWAKDREYTLDLISRTLPGIEDEHREGFQEAYARARYYRARYYMAMGKRGEALKVLGKNLAVDKRYVALFIIALLPISIWHSAHRWLHRSRLGATA